MEISMWAYQKIRSPFIKVCRILKITGNQITIVNHIITLTFGCYFFSRGTYDAGLLALLVCLVNGFLDYLDGDVARDQNKMGALGAWLDSGFDVIVQNAVMGAIAIGCYKTGLGVGWIVLFYISNTANNFVSFNYNQRFGFDSCKGNELFRNYMDTKPHLVNTLLKNLIDPTSSGWAIVLFTFRYYIVLGFLTGAMSQLFVVVTIIGMVKWIVMYTLYALHLMGSRSLHVLKALAILDEERNEFYALRQRKEM